MASIDSGALTASGMYVGYELRDRRRDRVGRVEEVFVGNSRDSAFAQVRIARFPHKSTLVPWPLIEVDASRKELRVDRDKAVVRGAPTLHGPIDDHLLRRVIDHFGTAGRSDAAAASRADRDAGATSAGSTGGPGVADEPVLADASGSKSPATGAGAAATRAHNEAEPADAEHERLERASETGPSRFGPRDTEEEVHMAEAKPAHLNEDLHAQLRAERAAPLQPGPGEHVEADAASRERIPVTSGADETGESIAVNEPVAGKTAAGKDAARQSADDATFASDDDADAFPVGMRLANRRWRPAFDVSESDDEYVICFDLPGVATDDLQIEVADDMLTVSGHRTPASAGTAHRRERPTGEFVQRLILRPRVNAESIKAEYVDGVLELHVAKPTRSRGKRITLGPRIGAPVG
jgi:HSP20 family protein